MATELTLVALRAPAESGPARRTIAQTPFTIGRGSDNDWVLVDADRKLSKRHCELRRRDAAWEVVDRSSNGTFLNGDATPLGPRAAVLATGDRLRLGPYEFAVRIESVASPPERRPREISKPSPESDMTAAPRAHAAAAPGGNASATLLDAFLRGAGVADLAVADPARTMEAAGAMFREMVRGLRAATAARATIKDEFRIEQTVLRARGNNPLRFATSDGEALVDLLDIADARAMPGARAVQEAARDLRLHELATAVAMQHAARTLFATLSPDRIDAGGVARALPFARKAQHWDSYVAAYAQLEEALADRFEAVWGGPFADAYDRSLAELRAADPEART